MVSTSTISNQFMEAMLAVFDRLADFPSDRAAWYFQELSRWPVPQPIADKAAEVARRMQAAGATPRCNPIRDFSHGYVSMIDGSGSRSVTLFFRTPEGGMDAVVLMINDIVGLKDAWCAFEDSSELEEAISKRMSDLRYAPCSLGFARELLADAWVIHQRDSRPLPGKLFIYRSYLGEQPIEPKSRQPNLGVYMFEMMIPSAEMVKGSDELAGYGPYGGLWFSSDAAYNWINQNMPKRGMKLNKERLDAFLREVATQERPRLLSRMAINLELESLAGRATQPINQLAARTYLGLQHEVRPFHEVPYLRTLAEKAVSMIITNLRDGFDNQRDANENALQQDIMLDNLLEGFPDWDDDK